jgi:acid phosphatase
MKRPMLVLVFVAVLAAACSSSAQPSSSQRTTAGTTPHSQSSSPHAPGGVSAGPIPRYQHIVVVVEENHAYSEIIGNRQAPYINSLARSGSLFTQSYAVAHPSEPNYLALFSGSTFGLTDDSCPHSYRAPNLGAQLAGHGMSFVGYSESLPHVGYTGCSYGTYARKHAPWTDFSNLPASVNKPMSAFPADYTQLPTVSFVVPNLDNDMHDGTIGEGDGWLRGHLGAYVSWAQSHDSLMILTWDEDDSSGSNHIVTIVVGAHVRTGDYSGRVDHYTVLRTVEAVYGLGGIGVAANRSPITSVWMP